MVKTRLDVVGNMEKKLNRIQGQLLSVNRKFKQQGTEISKVNAKLTQMNSKHKKNAKSSKAHKSAVSGLITQYFGITAAISAATRVLTSLIDYTKDSIKQFRSFEKRMREVSTILSDVGSDFENLSTGVQGMSLTFGKSADDLAKGLYNILSAAVPVSESLTFLYTASKAAVAGLTSVEKSVDVLTTVYNAYGKTVAQMQSVTDTMFQAVVRGKFRFEDLAASLGYVVPIAAQVGISFDELAAAMSTATRNGQHIDMVSRGLAMSIQNIIKPSEKAKRVAAEYGVELSQAALQARGLTGYLKYLNEASEGNASIISQIIPNMRSYRVMMVLAGEGVRDVEHDTSLMNTSLGQAEKAFGKVASSTQTAKDIITEYNNSVKRMTGEVTSNLDLLMSKFDTFKGFLVSNIFDPIKGGSGIIGNLSRSISQTNHVIGLTNKQLEKNMTKWEESQKPFEREPDLFANVLAGEEIDTAGIEKAKQDYEDALTAATEFGDVYKEEMGKTGAARMNEGDLAIMGIHYSLLKTEAQEAKAAWNVFKGSMDDAEESTEKYYNAIATTLTEMKKLRDEVGEVGNLYDGTLGKELQVAEQSKKVGDMSHYIALAKEEERYELELAEQNYEWYTADVAEAIEVVRNYEKQTKEATQAQNEFNEALARNRIETMKIQLIGMMRRRGNTRAEQRMLKKLSIERTELQIEAAEDALDAELNTTEEGMSAKETAYNNSVELLEKLQRKEEHNLWVLKDTRGQDVRDLKATIQYKEGLYNSYAQTLRDNQDKMNTSVEAFETVAYALYGDEEDGLPAWLQTNIDLMKELVIEQNKLSGIEIGQTESEGITKTSPVPMQQTYIQSNPALSALPEAVRKNLIGFQRGTNYVPSEGMYQLHRGEQVLTRQEVDKSNNGVTVNVNVTGNTIAENNVDTIAQEIADQVQKGLIDSRTGKSKYRMR